MDKKLISAYTIFRYSDGSTQVDNTTDESTEKLSTEEIFSDILTVAKQVENKRQSDLIKHTVVNAINDYFTAVQNEERAREIESEADENQIQIDLPDAE